MNTFDDNNFETETSDFTDHSHSEPSESTYTNEAAERSAQNTGRKTSPYADSPYVSYHETNRTAPPRQDPAGSPAPGKRHGNFGRAAVSAVLTVALVAGGCAVTAAGVNRHWEKQNAQTTQELMAQINDLKSQINASSKSNGISISGTTLADGAMTPSQVYARNVDSVVAITCSVRTSAYGQVMEGTTAGSGFILTDNGYVVTNYHVVEGASSITVTTHDNTEYEATMIGRDSTTDVAVLTIEAENLPAVTLGSSEDLIIGDMVVAIGNPLGTLNATQTVGYVSGKNRDVTTEKKVINMLQTDVAINSGNSGGPLFNMKGEVVGITTAKYSGSTSSGASIEGISFAIPIDDVKQSIDDLQNLGYVTGAYLGITVQDMDASSVSMYGLPTGAYVVSVVDGGSADRAGVKAKDIITALGDYSVSSMTELTRALKNFRSGDETVITVVRGGQELKLDITLDERPQDLDSQDSAAASMPSEGNYDEWFDYFNKYFGRDKG